MHDFGSADTDKDSQNFQTGYFLSEGCVEAGAALFNITKVKARGESDCLDVVTGVVRIAQFIIISWNRRMAARVFSQTRDCVRESRTEIRLGGAAIASPPAGIHRELLKVRKPPSLRDERDL